MCAYPGCFSDHFPNEFTPMVVRCIQVFQTKVIWRELWFILTVEDVSTTYYSVVKYQIRNEEICKIIHLTESLVDLQFEMAHSSRN